MEIKSNLRFEHEDDAVWVFSGDSHQGTEISHLITSHIDDYNEVDVRLICHYAANEIDRLRAKLAKATPEGFVLMPIKPTETMVMAVAKEHEGDAFLPYSLYDAFVKQAMIEAQEQSHDSQNT